MKFTKSIFWNGEWSMLLSIPLLILFYWGGCDGAVRMWHFIPLMTLVWIPVSLIGCFLILTLLLLALTVVFSFAAPLMIDRWHQRNVNRDEKDPTAKTLLVLTGTYIGLKIVYFTGAFLGLYFFLLLGGYHGG